jgi:transposase
LSWDELYPVIKTQAYFAVLRYEEPERRRDKIQELVCQSYEKFQNDVLKGKEITKQGFKYFVTSRAKQVDQRSICKKGYGGTSTLDALSFYRRRPDVDTEIVEFDEWMTAKPWSRDAVENQISFQIDFQYWQQTLTTQEKTILSHLMQGYKAKDIADILSLTYQTVRTIILKLKQLFLEYFRLEEFAYP